MRTLFAVLLLVGCSGPSARPDAIPGIDVIEAEIEVYLTGKVLDAAGIAVADAKVEVFHDGGGFTGIEATSGADGRYVISIMSSPILPIAIYGYLRVTKTGYLDTFHWPGPLAHDDFALDLLVISAVERDQLYARAAITRDSTKLLMRVLVKDAGGGAIDGATLTSAPVSESTVPTDTDGIGYLYNADTYLKITATKTSKSASTLWMRAEEQAGHFTSATVALP